MGRLTDKFTSDFKSGHLNRGDLIILSIHLAGGLLVWSTYNYDLVNNKILKDFTSTYFFLVPFLLVGLFFRKLRKPKFYLIWLMISIIQLIIYPMVKTNPDFDFPRGTAFDGMVALLPTLIVYQLLRQAFYSIKGQEMIISLRQHRWTMYEGEDRRNMTWLDIVFSIILGLTATLSGIFLTS